MITQYNHDLINWLSTEEALSLCATFMRMGLHTDAVKLLCDVFLDELEHCPELLDKEKLYPLNSRYLDRHNKTAKDWPNIGAKVIWDGSPIRMSFEKDRFSAVDAVTYYRFLKKLIQASRARRSHSNRISLMFILVWTDIKIKAIKLIKRLAEFLITKNSVERDSLLLRSIVRLMLDLDDSHQEQYQRSVDAISLVLHEPVNSAERICRANQTSMYIQAVYRRLKRSNPNTLQERLSSIDWDEEREFSQFLKSYNRPIVIAASHFGRHGLVLEKIKSIFQEIQIKELIHLTQIDSTTQADEEFRIEKEFGAGYSTKYTPMVVLQANYMEIIKRLRKDNACLYIYTDLPPSTGETIEVEFLGRAAYFPKGAAEVAIMARATVIPLISYYNGGRIQMNMGNLITSDLHPGEDMKVATRRISQSVISFLEVAIKQYPEQWQFIALVQRYLVNQKGILADG